MKIGVLQTGMVPDALVGTHGEYPDMFERFLDGQGFDFARWNVTQGDLPADPTEADGWLITGSRHGVYEDHAWLPPLEAFIRAARDADRPMVGVCFGHQVMAQALGGDVAKFDGGWVVGTQDYDFGGRNMALAAWHQDQVLTPPDGAQTIATQANCAHAALYYPGWGLSIQPHPEFNSDFIDGLIRHRGSGVVPDPLLTEATANLDRPLDNGTVAERIGRFFRERTAI